MNSFMNGVIDKAKATLSQAAANMKEAIFSITGTSSVSVSQMAGYIENHPDTKCTGRTMLGQRYSFYRLSIGDIHYYMEKKDSFILQVDVFTREHSIVSFRSYRDRHSLSAPINIPDIPAK
ncbi:hypothetical protein [Peribacillus glennii]|uniref:Uncharacterized protein n=1 Tax=Peribacillus glennii TaxID=2303991 RepID=A0A372LGR4_9BACI|nr:hypothetical protein [Peribacillus glennii]RFU65490.1 hypothetical protein D0466_06275 [Peribacillus glennii]